MPEPPASYFVIPVVRDIDGRPRPGSRFRCLSYAEAIDLAQAFMGEFSGVIVLDGDGAKVIAVFGDVPNEIQAIAEAIAK